MSELTLYDVVVVGGGPMGLSTAYQCAVKEGKRVLVLEQFTFQNTYGSSPDCGRQFRTCYSERNLCELAIKTSPMWDELMRDLDNDTLLVRTGCLWFGDAGVHCSEGNIAAAVKNLKVLEQVEGEDWHLIEGSEQIKNDQRFSFIQGAIDNIDEPKALFVSDGGTINVPALIRCLADALRSSPTADLVDHARVTCVDYSDDTELLVSIDSGRKYRARKVVMTPGTYVNQVLSSLTPPFTKEIKLKIYLWSSTYFQSAPAQPDTEPHGDPTRWPTWYFFGQAKPNSDDGVLNSNCFYGFPSDVKRPGYVRVAPGFTSKEEFDYQNTPPAWDSERPVDWDAMKYTSEFVKASMPSLSPSLIPAEQSTCVAGFAELVQPHPAVEDNGAGFVLDFLPGEKIGKRIAVFTGGWAMKYVPSIGKILADMVIRGGTEHERLIGPMSISRGVLEEVGRSDIAST